MSPLWSPAPQFAWIASQVPDARITSAAVSVANGTVPAAIALNTVAYDTSLGDTMTASPGQIIVPATGVYRIAGGGSFGSNATGVVRRVGFILAGVLTEGTQLVQNSSAITVEVSASDEAKLNAGDAVQLAAAQNSGGALNLNNASLAVSWVSSG